MPGEVPFRRDYAIQPGPGVRIVLDLSDFGGLRPERRLRCVYLAHDKYASVKDVKKHVKKSILKTEAKIQLFLGGKFWIPSGESVNVLQVLLRFTEELENVTQSLRTFIFRTMMW